MQELESDKLSTAVAALEPRGLERPQVALVLGSGLGEFADGLQAAHPVPYDEVPHMPGSGVAGHAGRFVFGRCGGLPVVAMQGRVHLYEGHTPAAVVFGLRLMLRLGAHSVVLTNAAGGTRTDWQVGDLMLIEDHLNLTGTTCLGGPPDPALGERFVDMSAAYDPQLRSLAQRVASERKLVLRTGIYAGLRGPAYETPAEIRMLRTLGADAVGMSTVLETMAARQLGARCLGISCITNWAAGLSPVPLSHDEVQHTAARVASDFASLVEGCLVGLSRPAA